MTKEEVEADTGQSLDEKTKPKVFGMVSDPDKSVYGDTKLAVLDADGVFIESFTFSVLTLRRNEG